MHTKDDSDKNRKTFEGSKVLNVYPIVISLFKAAGEHSNTNKNFS